MADDVTTEDFAKPCNLCYKNAGIYTCPRCNIPYCSVDCYKCEAHAQCSEEFYKKSFMTALHEMKSGSDEKERMLEMLDKLEKENPMLNTEEDVENVIEEEALADRLHGLDIDKDTEKIWQVLSSEEKKEFKEMMKDGRLGNMLELWQPWWSKQIEKPLVEDLSDERPTISPDVPKVLTNTSHNLCPSGQGVDLQYDLVDILYTYVYVCRLYNGAHLDLAHQAAQDSLCLSGSLSKCHHRSLSEVTVSCRERRLKSGEGVKTSEEFSLSVFTDVCSILRGSPLFVMAALSEFHLLFKTARKAISAELKSSGCEKDTAALKLEKKECFAVQKKLEYFLSWIQSAKPSFETLITELDVEICLMSSQLGDHDRDKQHLEDSWGGARPPKASPLIQEMEPS